MFKEIVTKAVIGKGKKYFNLQYFALHALYFVQFPVYRTKNLPSQKKHWHAKSFCLVYYDAFAFFPPNITASKSFAFFST